MPGGRAFGSNRTMGYSMGECEKWDAPAHSDHVCDAFKAKSLKVVKDRSVTMSKEDTVLRIVG